MRISRIAVLATVALVATGAAVAADAVGIPDGNGVIHGCYQAENGMLRVVPAETPCRDSELALRWNERGQQGLPGEEGPRGEQGPRGEVGPQGPAGLSGYEVVTESGGSNSVDVRLLTADCPAGKRLIGGGAHIFLGPGVMGHVALVNSGPWGTAWMARASEIGTGTSGDWSLEVHAVCAVVAD